MSLPRLRTVALVARDPGLVLLRDALIGHPNLDLCAVVTHGQRPKDEGGGQRAEVALYEAACKAAGVPLIVADGAKAKALETLLPAGPLDLLVSLSWRYILPAAVLTRFKGGCLNLHRGALPAYAGAKPVQRAIEAGERRVAICCHEMVEEVDAGEIYAQVWMDIAPLKAGQTAAVYAEDVKLALTPLYAPLGKAAIAAKLATLGFVR